MKSMKYLTLLLALVLLLTACNSPSATTKAVDIVLSDNGITVDGNSAGTDSTSAVYTANDIVYYEDGKDFIYGEGTEKDAHSAEEAASHTVVHITKPGTYKITGTLSLGQIAVDLGDGAKKDPKAVVTLILNGVDITCQVAPAVIFYNVYECGNDEEKSATKDVDTSAAGANVIIASDTTNNIHGAYVARIYEPKSVILNGDNTEVVESEKLHKYDGAFYSKQSMNISCQKGTPGVLNIYGQNEGLDSEMHLTINGGIINIESGNDGINTNEDNISVATINGGELSIKVTGTTGEGDGIDSNGWLVINGGTLVASACGNSADAGIDSDKGIHINGGTVIATGNMLDRIENGGQNYAVFNFAQAQTGGETAVLKDSDGNTVLETKPENAYSILIFSSPDLKAGTYTLWSNGQQLAGSVGSISGGQGMRPGGNMRPGNMQMPEGFTPPEGGARPGGGKWQEGGKRPEGNTPPEGSKRPEGGKRPEGSTRPEGGTPPEGFTFPEGFTPPEGGNWPQRDNKPENSGSGNTAAPEVSPNFTINDGGNMFTNIRVADSN